MSRIRYLQKKNLAFVSSKQITWLAHCEKIYSCFLLEKYKKLGPRDPPPSTRKSKWSVPKRVNRVMNMMFNCCKYIPFLLLISFWMSFMFKINILFTLYFRIKKKKNFSHLSIFWKEKNSPNKSRINSFKVKNIVKMGET